MDIKYLAEKYKLEHDDFWKCHDNWILTHDACTKIGHREKITVFKIESIYCDENSVRFLITMVQKDSAGVVINSVTSVGEADKSNCTSKYLGCMAEKRGRDRCILKLIKAYEWGIYSEEEAEAFKKEKSTYENR